MYRKKAHNGEVRVEGEAANNDSYGATLVTAGMGAYKGNELESSTVSPDPSNRMSGFSTGPGEMPYTGQALYPVEEHELPAGEPYQQRFPVTYAELSSETGAQMLGTQSQREMTGYNGQPYPVGHELHGPNSPH
jgi:hypothetical protein